MTSLSDISKIAKSDKARAEKKLLDFVKLQFPKLGADSIKINSSQVSLNSVNGFIETGKEEYFFKFHSEEGECSSLAETEYYQAEALSKAGLPILKPLYASTKPGKQFLIYKKINAPTAFEEFEKLENQYFSEGKCNEKKLNELLEAEKNLLKKQSEVFLKTLRPISEEELENAQINQLFYNRLVGKNGEKSRLDLYYNSNPEFKRLENLKWKINGITYENSLNQIINKAKQTLSPISTTTNQQGKSDSQTTNSSKQCNISTTTNQQSKSDSPSPPPGVVGHGDGHNGNKFFMDKEFILFDPAFAGIQPALLSFVKATAHNVFTHPFWLYDTARLLGKLKMSVEISGDVVEVRHNWDLDFVSPLREKIFDLQIKHIWKPLISEMERRGMLPINWKEYLRSALFCCPFLVYDLFDRKVFTRDQSILAISKCVELAHKDLIPLKIKEP